jgi:hypothetical protein
MTVDAHKIIKAGERVRIKSDWQDAGHDAFIWIAVTDDGGGIVTIEPQLGSCSICNNVLPLTWSSARIETSVRRITDRNSSTNRTAIPDHESGSFGRRNS